MSPAPAERSGKQPSRKSIAAPSRGSGQNAPPPQPMYKPLPDDVPGVLGPYEMLDEIGRGGMGLVLRGRDGALKREVAVKMLHPDAARDKEQRLRFIEEAQITGQLEHPGIAPVHFLGRDTSGREFFSMKLVSGQTLDGILTRWHDGDRETRAEFPLPRLLSIFERVCETVGFAHSRGVIHRDLKPSNVMIGTYGEVWVLDWGLAKVIKGLTEEETVEEPRKAVASVRDDLGKGLTLDGLTVGTPEYMAPEQALGEPLGEFTDVFGLGGLLYHVLTGQSPIRGKTVQERLTKAADGKFSPVRKTGLGRRAPPALAAIAERCLAFEREKRYPSTRQLLLDLRAYAADEPVSALPDTPVARLRRYGRRHRMAIALAGGLAALFLVIVTVSAVLVAKKDSQALLAKIEAEAEHQRAQTAQTASEQERSKRLQAESVSERERARRLQAELDKQKAQAESAARAQRRLKAFEPYAQALDLLMRGQLPQKSTDLLKEALATDPDFPEAQFALGESLRGYGAPEQAAAAYLKADELSMKISNRPNLQAILAAGFAFDSAGRYVEAEAAFKRADELGADDPLAMVGRVFRLGHNCRFREALKVAQEARERGMHLWETHFAVGYVLAECHKYGMSAPDTWREPALAALRKAQELSPRQAEICVWLGNVVSSGGTAQDQKEAEALTDRAVELEPLNGCRRLLRASARQGRGDGNGAAEDIAEAKRLGVASHLLKFHEAKAAERKGDQAESFRLMGEVVRESSDWAPLVANWLIGAINCGKSHDAKPVLDRLAKNSPEFPFVFYLRATMLTEERNYLAAAAEVQKGLQVAPYLPQLRRYEVELLALTGKHREAVEAADRVLAIWPRDYTAKQTRALSLARLGRFDEALAQVGKMEKEHPEKAARVEDLRRQVEAARGGKKGD